MAINIDAAAVLVRDVPRDRRSAVAFEGEVGVVEMDAAAISLRQGGVWGVDRAVRLNVGVVLHRELGVGAARIDAAAKLRLVVADGAARHRDGAVVAAGPNAAAAAEHDTARDGLVVGDDGVGHVERAVVAVHLHGAARFVGIVARDCDLHEVEGRPLLHVYAAGGLAAVPARHKAAAGKRGLIAGREFSEGERGPCPAAVEGQGGVLVHPYHGAVVRDVATAVDLVSVHHDGHRPALEHHERARQVPVAVHDHRRARERRRPRLHGAVVRGRAVLCVAERPGLLLFGSQADTGREGEQGQRGRAGQGDEGRASARKGMGSTHGALLGLQDSLGTCGL